MSVVGLGGRVFDSYRFIIHAGNEFDGVFLLEIGHLKNLRWDSHDKRVATLPDGPHRVRNSLIGIELDTLGHSSICTLCSHESYLSKTLPIGYKYLGANDD